MKIKCCTSEKLDKRHIPEVVRQNHQDVFFQSHTHLEKLYFLNSFINLYKIVGIFDEKINEK